jgi:hypothetical protein
MLDPRSLVWYFSTAARLGPVFWPCHPWRHAPSLLVCGFVVCCDGLIIRLLLSDVNRNLLCTAKKFGCQLQTIRRSAGRFPCYVLARELAAGRVQWKRWVHPDDVPALAEYADKLARKRARAEQKAC